MAIPIRVRECFDAFAIDCGGGEEETSCLEDELGRFKVWAGNIAAHRPAHSRRSLEYRLRDSSGLREMVLLLLQDLLIAIQDVRKQLLLTDASMSNDRSSNEIAVPTILVETELRPDDAKHDYTDMFELSDEESIDEETPVRRALGEIHDVITCLLRFSMTLRSPSRDDQRRDDPRGVAEAFVPHDTEHVRAKFPKAPEYLVRRLGRTLSKHRQYFRYRREHHQKLHDGLDEGDPNVLELPSTVATSLPNDTSNVQNPGTDSETESAYTATSYAGTSTSNATLHVPPWPDNAQAGWPFECPICFGIIVAESEISWRRHVFEDLPPYICLSETCHSAVKSFSRRREWARHNDTMHDRTLECPCACGKPVNAPAELRSHLAAEHAHSVLPQVMQKTAIASGRIAEMNTPSPCPLCTRQYKAGKPWTKHVGHHLEQLALFSLPMELFATDTPDGSGEEQNDDEGHSSALASRSEHPEDNDFLSGDPTSEVEETQASELLVSDIPDPIMRPNDIGLVTEEPSSQNDNQDHVRSEAGTSELEILEDGPAIEEIEELRKMTKSRDDQRMAREAAIIAAEELKKLEAEQEQEALDAGQISAADVDAETAAAKDRPLFDMEQAPIKFKDAVGRKLSFPWHLCKSWKGMESLIKQAFLHVDVIGKLVQDGHYDLTGPDGEIILPQVWDTMIKPDMLISMHMWPIPDKTQKIHHESIPPQEQRDSSSETMPRPPRHANADQYRSRHRASSPLRDVTLP
jgi:hypothetical protein